MKPWAVLCVVAFLAGCGRQVSPIPADAGPGGASPGYASVKFDVAAPFDVSKYEYWIVFNTSGTAVTPGTNVLADNWAGYSSAIVVTGTGGSIAVQADDFISNGNGQAPYLQPLNAPPQLLTFNVNSNGNGTEFTAIFQRSIFTPLSSSTAFGNTWRFNAFTTTPNPLNRLTFVDSMGAGGAVDPQFVSPALDVTTSFDRSIYALSSGLQIDPAARIVSVELANNP
jgi:hypothetical protein